jgi:hypothetical protein
MRVRTKIVFAAVGFLLLIAVAGAMVMMGGPRNLLGMLRYDQRQEGSLRVGDHAPDVTLSTLDGAAPVRLSGHIGDRPLVLIFGSFT